VQLNGNWAIAAAGAVLAATLPAASSSAGPVFDVTAAPQNAPAGAETIPVYGSANPGSPADEIETRFMGRELVLRNITYPTVTVVQPPEGKSNGTAVIVAPGGGFAMLSMQNEGWRVANALAEQGVTAFVLKYRLNPTPKDDKTFNDNLAEMFAAAGKSDAMSPELANPGADQDALAALRLIRGRADQWHINPKRVGMIGFSAGAITALRAVQNAPTAAERPDFVGYIYGPMEQVVVPAGAPPLFAALAMDDMLFGKTDFGLVQAWRQARRPVELHVYQSGNHGFGLGVPGTTTTGMIGQFLAWLDARGLLTPEAKR
jgi:acetyl esterase/lipase